MDTSFVEVLRRRAETMLPPATVMRVECLADSGVPGMEALLEEIQGKGLRGEPLCEKPCRTLVYEDRVLLVCDGCERQKELPRICGIGYGHTKREAEENALYALTLPADKRNAGKRGCIVCHRYGEGKEKAERCTCVFNRVAYAARP